MDFPLLSVAAKALGWQVPEGQSGFVGFGSYSATPDPFEKALMPGPYICGKQFTVADVYIGSLFGWGMTFGTIEKRPLPEAYVERLYLRLTVQQATCINEDYLKNRNPWPAGREGRFVMNRIRVPRLPPRYRYLK
jgi:glutathione S-transferase